MKLEKARLLRKEVERCKSIVRVLKNQPSVPMMRCDRIERKNQRDRVESDSGTSVRALHLPVENTRLYYAAVRKRPSKPNCTCVNLVDTTVRVIRVRSAANSANRPLLLLLVTTSAGHQVPYAKRRLRVEVGLQALNDMRVVRRARHHHLSCTAHVVARSSTVRPIAAERAVGLVCVRAVVVERVAQRLSLR